LFEDGYKDSELVIALVGAVGTELGRISQTLTELLRRYRYTTEEIRISANVIGEMVELQDFDDHDEYGRISGCMDAGNSLRDKYKDNSILALGAAARINQKRAIKNGAKEPLKRHAFILNSLKNEDEVARLREIYTDGLFVIGVHSSDQRRLHYLVENLGIPLEKAKALMVRDHDETDGHGQHTSRTFHLSDFFIDENGDNDKVTADLGRILKLIFGHPYITPTFDEFAMFMAFTSSLRSADLSRQVGAVIAKDKRIISTGANDVPAFGGGLYWPDLSAEGKEISDADGGRDHTRGVDENVKQTNELINEIVARFPEELRTTASAILSDSPIKNITEYGRVVHAEMDAILACARANESAAGAALYSTTFPCHNCAKHIIATGIRRVVYVEPYAKSKALEFHDDSIALGNPAESIKGKVVFEPFVGVGPRSFFNLFSIGLGNGSPINRKTKDGKIVKWETESAKLRMQMLPTSYVERESLATNALEEYLGGNDERANH